MNKTSPGKQALSWLLAAAMSVSLLPVSAFAAEETADAEREDQQEESAVPIVSEDTEEDDAENAEEADAEEYISLQTEDVPVPQSEEDRYYLMNIPYDKFYSAIGATDNSTDFDAITSATHKVANYGMAGGSYHAEQTAQIAEDGTITAVGKDNNAKFGGVTWPVKVSVGTDLSRLGGAEIPLDATRTPGSDYCQLPLRVRVPDGSGSIFLLPVGRGAGVLFGAERRCCLQQWKQSCCHQRRGCNG